MPTRQFNGHEISFLIGNSEDSKQDFIVSSEKLGRRYDGYEYDRVIVKHPDGKLYQFEYGYDTEHGILPCHEDPDELTDAVEVEAFETVAVAYRVKK